MIGRTVSHYRIEEKLGQGGMGVVYKAEDVRLKRPVALKFLPPHLVADLRAKERFLREAQAASALDHPNVGVVFDMDETDDGESFIAMAYYGGETVADKLEQGPLSVDDAVDFALQAARGLSRAHARGIVHRDVKPANLMVTDEGVLKILDFGLAKLAGAAHITGTGRALGTVAYMAPEQAAQDEATVQSDIWALGVVLYEMLSGRLPFRGGSPVAVLYHVLHEEPDPIRELRRETPAGLERVVARALAKDPSRRYQDLAEMVADLETVVSGSRGVGARIEPEPALGERSAAFERTSFSFPPLHPHVTDDTEFQVFVGRESELEQLDAWFQEALDGRGRVGFISGEAGCGKTVLAREFGRRATELDDRVTVATGRCNAHTGVGDPYHPFREILGLLTGDVEAQWSAGSLRADQATRLWSLVPSTVTALVEGGPELLGTIVPGAPLIARAQGHPGLQVGLLEDLRQLVDKSAAASSARQFDLFEQYVRVLRALAKERLLVLIVDDLQWADSGSVSLFFHLARELTGSRVLMLGLFRPSEVAVGRGGERHPFEPVLNEIKASFRDPEIRFGPTGDRQFVEALIDSEPNRLGPPFRASLFEQTRGHALFTVELLRGLEDQGLLLRDEEDRWMEHPHLEWDFLPARVEAVIEQRIGRLPPELQRILSIASVEGEEFTLEAVARAHGADTREILAPVSLELEKRHRLVTAVGFRRVDGQRLSVYRFRHILFQRYLYDHLDQVERALLHEHLGEALESLHGDAVDDIALQLARHFQAAEMPNKAARYLHLAGERATRSGMFPEAIGHLEASLELLLTLPASTDRDREELETQVVLGIARQAAYAPGQEAVFERARELAERLGDNHHLFWALMGLFGGRGYYGGDHRLGRQLIERCLEIAEEEDDVGLLVHAHEAAARNAEMRGQFRTVVEHELEVLRLFDPEKHLGRTFGDKAWAGAGARGIMARAKLHLGYPEEALQGLRDALADAKKADHVTGLTAVLQHATAIHHFLRDASALEADCKEMRSACAEAGLTAYWEPFILVREGWCAIQRGEVEQGTEAIRTGLNAFVARGGKMLVAYFTTYLAEALAASGDAAEGLRVLDEARAKYTVTDELYGEAEIQRTRGELLMALPEPRPIEAEAAFRSAIEVAQSLEAKWQELRATTSFARLLQSQHRETEAREMLSGIYGWFTEGFDTPDLVDAKALLEELSVGVSR